MTWTNSPFVPIVLLIEDQEWTARSLESILGPNGCAVFKAYTGHQGLDILRRVIPDLILVDCHLPDMTGAQVLHRLKEIPTVWPSTPRVLISTNPVSRDDRMAVLEEGAWDVLTPPFHPAELTLRFNTWIDAKRDVDRARDQGMVDPLTGLYNFNGLLRRIDELVSDASRNERFISLVAVGLPSSGSRLDKDEEEVTRLVGQALGKVTRLSDAVARVGPSEFVVVAPGTDSTGAGVLADRLVAAGASGDLQLRAGVFSSRRGRDEPITPLDLLNRVTEALRRAQSSPDGPPIFVQEKMN
jgi:PleD family two-component response regulator